MFSRGAFFCNVSLNALYSSLLSLLWLIIEPNMSDKRLKLCNENDFVS